MISITFKDGSSKAFEQGVTPIEIAKSISEGLARVACAASFDGELIDLRTPLAKDGALEILTFDSPGGKHAYWHTASHVMAQAIQHLWPQTSFAIGPAVDNGFYYDIDLDHTITPEDYEKIEAEMKKIIKADYPLERYELPPEEALAMMKEKNQQYKVELIEEHAAEGEPISFYKQGDFTDLCAGPHLLSTGKLKAVKIMQTTGAYWRADANNKMLQRVYGVAFPKAADLDAYLKMLEEAKRRDHRRIGRELELFMLTEEGPGFPFFLPKGMVLRNLLLDYWRQIHKEAGYVEISTPIILREELWHQSGHWDHYKDNMYTTTIDEHTFCIKPMNCPGGILVYKSKPRSYRDLPLRMGELGLVHRHELSGALHGLMRVRCVTQDDAHLYVTKEQIKDEVKGIVRLIDRIYKTFGFEYFVELSTRPEDSMGSEEDWEIATDALRDAITELGFPYTVNEGDGAFYGPKLDFHLRDCIGRTWQCGTIQLDFQMPERFELEYTGADGEKHRPTMLHRTAFGSIERFIAILTEHFAGAFPLWLAPVQVKVLPIAERNHEFAKAIFDKLEAAGLRAEIDLRSEKIGYKIREAQLEQIPYMLVLGDKEAQSGQVAVRGRRKGDMGVMSLDDFLALTAEEIASKATGLETEAAE